MAIATEQNPKTMLEQATLGNSISDLISAQFNHKSSHKISDLYKSVLNVIEPPMLDAIVAFTRYNQSKAAECLGLSRGNGIRLTKIHVYCDLLKIWRGCTP